MYEKNELIQEIHALAHKAKDNGFLLASVMLFTSAGALEHEHELPFAELCEAFVKDFNEITQHSITIH